MPDDLGSPAPDAVDFEIACWRCDEPSPADVYVRVVRHESYPRRTTIRSGHALCDSCFDELQGLSEIDVAVLEGKTRAVRGANYSQSLETWGASA